jgi:multifunctional 2-oxoglutarate metabolism enzyme
MNNKENEQQEAFGPNIWLVDEMYRQYQESPQSVGESWREFFEDYRPQRGQPNGERTAPTETKPAPPTAEQKPAEQ